MSELDIDLPSFSFLYPASEGMNVRLEYFCLSSPHTVAGSFCFEKVVGVLPMKPEKPADARGRSARTNEECMFDVYEVNLKSDKTSEVRLWSAGSRLMYRLLTFVSTPPLFFKITPEKIIPHDADLPEEFLAKFTNFAAQRLVHDEKADEAVPPGGLFTKREADPRRRSELL